MTNNETDHTVISTLLFVGGITMLVWITALVWGLADMVGLI